jgi:hypothetical protein
VSGLADKIKTQGYWSVIIRPETYDPKKVVYEELFPLIRRLSVSIRGWDFPHISDEGPIRDIDWVGQEIDWDNHVESWRFHQTGLFAYLGGYWIDWTTDTRNWSPKPPDPYVGKIIGVSDIAMRFYEFFKLAAGFALSDAGAEQMVVKIEAHHLNGRSLWVDSSSHFPFPSPNVARLVSFPQQGVFSREVLISRSDQLARDWARQLYARFGWEPSNEVVEVMQKKFSFRGKL